MNQMSDLIALSDSELDMVSGGQSISISATQSNSSSISQSATASNSGAVTARAGYYGLAVAVGAEASNTAVVSQANVIRAANVIRYY
jgi:hypothetical protein